MSPPSDLTSSTIEGIVCHNLCIGCGLCASACPEKAITVSWESKKVWQPSISGRKCTKCGSCFRVCPNSPQCIGEYAAKASQKGPEFGLPSEGAYFVSYDLDPTKRIQSASGGVTTALLEHLLSSGLVDGVLASMPVEGLAGEPHFHIQIIRSMEELDRCRSSHYHPLSYDRVLSELSGQQGRYAVVGVPCVLRGIKRLPAKIQEKIKYKVGLVCSHNVTGAFTDCLAKKEGVERGKPWRVNLRDKVNIPDANHFNNVFVLPDREIRRNRFDTAFTEMWRNYFFAQECCFYCPDLFGVDADISIKDAWGPLSKDPLGTSLLVVRNLEIKEELVSLKEQGKLFLKTCSASEVLASQRPTAEFKHVEVLDRISWKKILRPELKKRVPEKSTVRPQAPASWEYARLRLLMHVSSWFFQYIGWVPEKTLVRLSRLPGVVRRGLLALVTFPKRLFWDRFCAPFSRMCGRFFGVTQFPKSSEPGPMRVLIAGGYGYGNVGDEAQLGANLQHWKKMAPEARLTVLTPRPDYTSRVHLGVETELATRLSLFGRGAQQYFGGEAAFKKLFFPVAILCFLNACLKRAGLPVVGLTTRQARLLDELYNSDLLFLSGGGYLTGLTLTRLWENMLFIRLAHAFGVPVVLSGQTVGVFQGFIDRRLAHWGLKKAKLIYLRDHVDSPKDLAALGIEGEKVKCTFDDALFYRAASPKEVSRCLKDVGLDIERPYIAVNSHFWGQPADLSERMVSEMAECLDQVKSQLNLQVIFVPMHHTDEPASNQIINRMAEEAHMPSHNYEPSLAVGLIQNASLCLTLKHHPIVFALGAAVPVVSMVFDDYYWHKNFGALQIFGQEKFLLDGRKVEALSATLFTLIDMAWTEKEEIRKSSEEKLEVLQKDSGAAIKAWILQN